MKTKLVAYSLAALFVCGASFGLAESKTEKKNSLEGVKCLMNAKKDVNPEKAAKYKDGKVYFCCDGCLGKYEKMSEAKKAELATKANYQLVASKQYKQEACPFSGGKLNSETKIKLAGTEVSFCCNGCKGKAEKLEGDKQLAAVFGEKAFKKAKFTLVKHESK